MKNISAIILIMLCLTASVSAQKKIGLALSGGGALGMAHIGMLQALEEEGIVPDYITGVSMGSIVGGLYAMGYSADSIAIISRQTDWGLVLSDYMSERQVAYDEKASFRNELLNFSFSKGRIGGFSGIIKGQKITNMLEYYAWPSANQHNFDSLSVPYMAVATDVATCRPVLYKRGNIADVMRASMSVPSIFTPLNMNDTLLIDGGVTNNFAVSELKEMGADYIIGSYTGGDLLSNDQLDNFPAILLQISSFIGTYYAEEEKEKADFLVSYDFKGLTSLSFQECDSIINVGYRKAKKMMPNLIRDLRNNGYVFKKRKNILHSTSYVVNEVKFEGSTFFNDNLLAIWLGIKKGDIITADIMQKKMTELYGMNYFDKVSYRLDNAENGEVTLTVSCFDKALDQINLSVHYDDHYGVGINMSYKKYGWLWYNSRFSIDVFAAKYPRANINYLLYFGKKGRFSIAFGGNYYNDYTPAFYVEDNYRRLNFNHLSAYADIRLKLQNNGMLKAGISNEILITSPEIRTSNIWERAISNNLKYSLSYQFNNLDDYYFPHRGVSILAQYSITNPISFRYDYEGQSNTTPPTFNGDSYDRFLVKNRYYIPLSKRITLSAKTDAYLTTAKRSESSDFALIGGIHSIDKHFFTMYGMEQNAYATRNLAGIGLGLSWQFKSNLYAALYYDTYRFSEEMEIDQWDGYSGIALELAYRSVLGPVKIGLQNTNHSDFFINRKLKFYLSVGFEL